MKTGAVTAGAAGKHAAIAVGLNAGLVAIAALGGIFQERSGLSWLLAVVGLNLAASALVAAFELRGWDLASRRALAADVLTSFAGAVPLLVRETSLAGGFDLGNLLFVVFLLCRGAFLAWFPRANAPRLAAASVRSWILAATFLLCAAATFPVARRANTQGDEPHYLLATHSLVADGDLDLSNNYRERHYLPFFPAELVVRDVLVNARGADVPIHDVGISALLAPGYALGGYRGAMLELSLIGAFLALGIYELARRLGASQAAAVRGWGLFAFTSPLLVYSSQIYPEIVGATLTVWAVVSFARARRTGRSGPLLAAGAALGLLPWFSVRYWLIVAPIGLAILAWIFSTGGGRRAVAQRAAIVLSPGIVSVVLFCLFDLAVYQSPVPNAGYVLYMTERRPPMFTPQLLDISLAGLLFDRAFGLLPTAPLYLVAVAGIGSAWRSSRRVAAAMLATVAVFVLFAAVNQFWYGGYAPPPRYVFPVVALLAAFAPAVLERDDPGGVVRFLAGWSVVVAVLYTAFPETRLSFPDGKSALGGFFDRYFGMDPTAAFPSFLRAGLSDYLRALFWAAGATFCVLWMRKRAGRVVSSTGPTPDGSRSAIPSC